MKRCVALLLSGGTGTRLGAEIPKQYIQTGGRMMITRSLYALFQCEAIGCVQIVADAAWHEKIDRDWMAFCAGRPAGKDVAAQAGMQRVAEGFINGYSAPGANRQLSILHGLRDLAAEYPEDSIVMIHDAARPFVSAGQLERCIAACDVHDGAMPVLPMKDTVYYSENGAAVTRLLEREKIFAGQAPEAFVLGKYLEANEKLQERIPEIRGSTEPAILAGMDIAMIPGEESNFKVTTPADLERYERIVREREG